MQTLPLPKENQYLIYINLPQKYPHVLSKLMESIAGRANHSLLLIIHKHKIKKHLKIV